MTLVLLFLLIGGGNRIVSEPPQTCLLYGSASTTLRGRLIRKTFAGPPNYESVKKGDQPETYWILRLGRPMCVNGDDPETNVAEMQLVLSREQYAQGKHLIGKRVSVRGTLVHAISGHHHTNVLVDDAHIKPITKLSIESGTVPPDRKTY